LVEQFTAIATSRRVGIGAAIYFLWLLIDRPQLTPALLMFAPFVLVPMVLRLLAFSSGPSDPLMASIAKILPLPAASAALAFMMDPGFFAMLLTIPWLATTFVLGAVGIRRFLSRQRLSAADIALDASFVMLAKGGLWLTTTRLGANPLDFSDTIVQLTAVHFHYAGFTLCAVAGVLTWPRGGRMSAAIPIGVVVGVLFTAVGITYGGRVEWVAAVVMAFFGFCVGVLLVLEGEAESGTTAALLRLAGVSLMVGMVAAVMWAYSIRYGWEEVTLFRMLRAHGAVNAIGFGLLGVLGLNLKLLERVVSDEGEVIVRFGTGERAAADVAESGNALSFSYDFVGLTTADSFDSTNEDHIPAGFSVIHKSRGLGNADDALDKAADAMMHWRGHTGAGLRLAASTLDLEGGATVAFSLPMKVVSLVGASRVIDVVDDEDCFGFSYGTTNHHFAVGEERLLAHRNEDGYVTIDVFAVSRPGRVLTRLGGPVTRKLQERALSAWIDAVADGPAPPPDDTTIGDSESGEAC
jgi:uncharacterized protein (UPF0548 family)